jgi:hypothetical protein
VYFRTDSGLSGVPHEINVEIGMTRPLSGVRKMTKCAKDGFGTRRPQGYRPPSLRVSLRQALTIPLLLYSVVSVLSAPSAVAASEEIGGDVRWTALGNGVLKDDRTKLEWSRDDNGDDIDWNEAKSYCDGKRDGWVLPGLEELKSIYDEHEPGVRCGHANCKVSSQFHLTGAWFWSATQVGKDSTDGIELAWGVLMANGAQTQTVRDASYGSRVLCMRRR